MDLRRPPPPPLHTLRALYCRPEFEHLFEMDLRVGSRTRKPRTDTPVVEIFVEIVIWIRLGEIRASIAKQHRKDPLVGEICMRRGTGHGESRYCAAYARAVPKRNCTT